MKYDPQYHNRKSLRLHGYDYAQAGAYFVTICTGNRECYLGEIVDGKMILNTAGETAEKYLVSIPEHFPQAEIVNFIIMPNHVHLIMILHNLSESDVRTCHGMSLPDTNDINVGTRHGVSTPNIACAPNDVNTTHDVSLINGLSTPNDAFTTKGMSLQNQPNRNQFAKPISGSVSVIINQYKSSVKRWCNKNNHEYFTWQPRFHDHIIRNESSYQSISEYIKNNPAHWKEDKFYKE